MGARAIPIDSAIADESTLTSLEWTQAEGAHEHFKDLLKAKPRAKARFDVVLSEINGDR